MNKIINFIVWPTIAGLVFAFTLLQLPLLAAWLPGLNSYLPQSPPPQAFHTAAISYNEAISKASPAVVSINSHQGLVGTYIVDRQLYDRTLYDENNLGSGVIITPDGYIITSYHIIATQLNFELSTITLDDGREVEARPVMIDEKNDLALLKIDLDNLPYINIGNQANHEIGDVVLAIGNPRNIGKSATQGIISAVFRVADSYVIQTDADLNPGYSGGALIDIHGDLIGINSSIISESGGSEGIGFAVPASKAIALLNAYLDSGSGGFLGVTPIPLRASQGLINFGTSVQGILIGRIAGNSPADKSGLLVGDIIIGANGQRFKMENENSLVDAITFIGSAGPGQIVTLEIFRENIILDIPVTLSEGIPINVNPTQ